MYKLFAGMLTLRSWKNVSDPALDSLKVSWARCRVVVFRGDNADDWRRPDSERTLPVQQRL